MITFITLEFSLCTLAVSGWQALSQIVLKQQDAEMPGEPMVRRISVRSTIELTHIVWTGGQTSMNHAALNIHRSCSAEGEVAPCNGASPYVDWAGVETVLRVKKHCARRFTHHPYECNFISVLAVISRLLPLHFDFPTPLFFPIRLLII